MENEELYLKSCILSQKIAQTEFEIKKLENDKAVIKYAKLLEQQQKYYEKMNILVCEYNRSTKENKAR